MDERQPAVHDPQFAVNAMVGDVGVAAEDGLDQAAIAVIVPEHQVHGTGKPFGQLPHDER